VISHRQCRYLVRSAAISANCHRNKDDEDRSLVPVIWGFVGDKEGDSEGHYTFTIARDVGPSASG